MDKKVEVRISISYEDMDQIIGRMNSMINKYGLETQDFSVEADEEYGSVYPVLVFSRPETSEEKFSREIREAQYEAQRENYDRAQYEKLKKKFEGESN